MHKYKFESPGICPICRHRMTVIHYRKPREEIGHMRIFCKLCGLSTTEYGINEIEEAYDEIFSGRWHLRVNNKGDLID